MSNKDDYFEGAKKLYDKIAAVHHQKMIFWTENVVFTWQWWLGVSLTIVPWIIWFFMFRKKEYTGRLFAAGAFVIVISSWFDYIGVALGLWHYNFDVIPLLPAFAPWDFTLLPIIIMAVIQFKPNVTPFLKAIIFAGLSAFVGEPVFAWIRTYDPEQWKSIYSFPILIIIYLIAHYISSWNNFEKIK